jgi:hypothetical protein
MHVLLAQTANRTINPTNIIMSNNTDNAPSQALTMLTKLLELEEKTASYTAPSTQTKQIYAEFIQTFIAAKQSGRKEFEQDLANMRKKGKRFLADLAKGSEIRETARLVLRIAIDDCKLKKHNKLPVGPGAFPDGMWEAAQTELDDHCIVRGIPLAPGRRSVEYIKMGIYRDDMFD